MITRCKRLQWWPVRVRFNWLPYGHETRLEDWREVVGVGWHGWWIGTEGGEAVFGQTFHLGPLKIMCGRGWREREKGI